MHHDPLASVASRLAELIFQASELINVRVKLEHVASEFELSVAANWQTVVDQPADFRQFIVTNDMQQADTEVVAWLDDKTIPKIVVFSEDANLSPVKCYGLSRNADFALVSNEASSEIREMVALATNEDYFVIERTEGGYSAVPASAQAADGPRSSAPISREGGNSKRKRQSARRVYQVRVFGSDENTVHVLNAAADLKRNMREDDLKLYWTPTQSDELVTIESEQGTAAHIKSEEQFKSTNEIWSIVRAKSFSAKGITKVITNKAASPPRPLVEALNSLQRYPARYPRTSKYSFEEGAIDDNRWLMLKDDNGSLERIENAELLLSSRELSELIRDRINSLSPARFTLSKNNLDAEALDLPVVVVEADPPQLLDWVENAKSSSEMSPRGTDLPAEAQIESMVNYAQTLNGLAWVRRLEIAAREIAEHTLTDHVAHARWEQRQFDLQHKKQTEEERRAVEEANKALLSVLIALPIEEDAAQQKSVCDILRRMNKIQAKIGKATADPAAQAEQVFNDCEEIAEKTLSTEDQSESKKGPAQEIVEAITSALQAPLRFVLPFAFIIAPLILAFSSSDSSKTDSQVLQSTIRTYGFLLLPFFFLIAAGSRFLTLQERKKRRAQRRLELLRTELIARLSSDRAQLIAENTSSAEKMIEERLKLRSEEGRRIERRLSSLEAVRTSINEALSHARDLRHKTFNALPKLNHFAVTPKQRQIAAVTDHHVEAPQ